MDNYSIFNDIYDIKEKINDQEFITLNNKVRDLIMALEQNNNNDEDHYYPDDNLEEDEYESEDEEYDMNECVCDLSTKYVYNGYLNMGCVHNPDVMVRRCEKFRRLTNEIPLLKNLQGLLGNTHLMKDIIINENLTFDQHNSFDKELTFSTDLYDKKVCCKDHFVDSFNTLMVLFNLEYFNNPYVKSFMALVMFDYMLRLDINVDTSKFIRLYKLAVTKYTEALQREEFLLICRFFKVDHTIYPRLFNTIIDGIKSQIDNKNQELVNNIYC